MKIATIIVFVIMAGCANVSNLPNVTNASGTSASGQISKGTIPLQGVGNVSMHPDMTLRMNQSCTKIMKLNFGQTQDYRSVLQELKNRALIMGGNSVSLVEWFENNNATGYVGNIYLCNDKTYHVHPHPA
ncbi:hypothetical protein OA005_01215 [Paracoccaceae bacterium]|nr:hypothetical protein [Paracoccaceae bacterium]